MRAKQIRLERPTLKAAHRYHQEGTFCVDPDRHYLSRQETESEVSKISDDLYLVAKRFPRTQNLEYAVLKAHLIIERALVQYIRSRAEIHVDENALRFSFSQKLEIAYLLGFGARIP